MKRLLKSSDTGMRIARAVHYLFRKPDARRARLSATVPLQSRAFLGKGAAGVACVAGLLLAWTLSVLASQPPNLKIKAQLIWGTNEKTSPNENHKPVGAELKNKLQELPLKWTNYFEVKNVIVEVPPGGSRKVPLSDKCELEFKDRGQSEIQVSHFGNGKHIGTRTQSLPKGETLILGGNAPGATSWLVVLRRLE